MSRMTPAALRAICDSLNDERGTGGQSKLARLCGWHPSTIWRKLSGKSRITRADELAVLAAVPKAGIEPAAQGFSGPCSTD